MLNIVDLYCNLQILTNRIFVIFLLSRVFGGIWKSFKSFDLVGTAQLADVVFDFFLLFFKKCANWDCRTDIAVNSYVIDTGIWIWLI